MAQKKYVSLTRLSNFLDNIKAKYSQIGHKHTISDITDYKVDTALSSTSNNPIANKTVDAEFEAVATAMNALDLALDSKANASHDHNDKYYTETEIDTKLATKSDTTHKHDNLYDTKGSAAAVQTNLDTVSDTLKSHTDNTGIHVTTSNKTNWNSAYTHSTSAHARTDATKVEDSTTNGNIKINGTETNVYSHPNSGVTAGTYKSVTVNAQGHVTAGSNPTTLSGYGITDAETKSDAASKLTEAKTYADNAANTVKNDLLNGAGTAYDTLKELGDLINENTDAIDALEEIAAGKANATHTHAISDVSGLQSALDGKAASSHGTHVTYSTTAPVMDGTAAVGTASTVARSDHKHPTDTSRAAKTDFDNHTANTTVHITSTERSNWNTAATTASSAQTKANSAYALAEGKVDSLSDLGITATATELNKLDGVTATTAELNYIDGVTSNIQTQLDSKQASITGGATTIASSNLTASRALVSNSSGKVAVSAVTSTELGYLDGVTSSIQTQLNGKSTATNLVNGSVSGSLRSTGASTTIGTGAFAVGYGTTASGNYSFAEGYNTTAEAKYAHAEGNDTTASGYNSHAEGERTVASLASAHAEGTETTASGGSAHSEGQGTTASGSSSHAEGFTTTASGSYSHAEGGDTLASGSGSHAEGFGTIAKGSYQHVQGTYNVEDTNNKYAHIVGKGKTATSRSNAHTIDWQGNAWFAGNIYTGGTSQSSGATMLASMSTLTTAEYTALEEAQATNANTLYMLTDAEDDVLITVEDIDEICGATV